jgi:hypothetical protein
MIDHSNNVPPKEIFGDTDAFRAELAKLEPEQPQVEEPTPEQSSEDTLNMSHDETPGEENIPEESVDEVVEIDQNQATAPTETSGSEKSHLIPKSRFNQEIEKRKALEEQLTKEREERIRIEAQWEMLNQHNQQTQLQEQQQYVAAQQQALDNIDPLDTDTFNYAKREIEGLKAQLANVAKENEQRTKEMIYTNRVTSDQSNFEKIHPDFTQALEHVQKVELEVAKQLFGNEQHAQNFVADKMRGVLTTSIESGKNAAETIYNMAKTYGYNTTSKSEKTKPTINVEAINKNMAASANTSNIGNSGIVGSMPVDIKAALDKHNRIDPDLFHKQLARLQSKNM